MRNARGGWHGFGFEFGRQLRHGLTRPKVEGEPQLVWCLPDDLPDDPDGLLPFQLKCSRRPASPPRLQRRGPSFSPPRHPAPQRLTGHAEDSGRLHLRHPRPNRIDRLAPQILLRRRRKASSISASHTASLAALTTKCNLLIALINNTRISCGAGARMRTRRSSYCRPPPCREAPSAASGCSTARSSSAMNPRITSSPAAEQYS